MEYTEIDGILYPNVTMEGAEEGRSLGKYGSMRNRHLKEHYPVRWTHMFCQGELLPHLYRIDEQASERVEQMVEHMAANADLPDKMTQPYQWAQQMSMLKAQAEEVVYREMIYTEEDG